MRQYPEGRVSKDQRRDNGEDSAIKGRDAAKLRVLLSKRLGFCFGVKRAVSMAEATLKRKGPIYSLGSLIHNDQVVRALSQKGLKSAKGLSDINNGTVVISSHGIGPDTAEALKKKRVRIVDTTCPFVRNAQDIARRLMREGYRIIIVGDARHPEVKALVGFAGGRARVIKDRFEARGLAVARGERISVISQTTQSSKNFTETVKVIAEKNFSELRVCNTICNDAERRQEEASRIASDVDIMLVVGGRHSANTKRLLEVCRIAKKNSHLVEKEGEINKRWFKSCESVGITSGASTPDWIINRVVDKINEKKGVVRTK